MFIKVLPDDFKYRDWGKMFRANNVTDLSFGVFLVAANIAKKLSNWDLYPFCVVIKDLYIPSQFPCGAIFLDDTLDEDEYYILMQDTKGENRMIFYSPGI